MNKTLIAALILSTLSSPAPAEDVCATLSDLAGFLMDKRYSGELMSTMIAGIHTGDANADNLIKDIIRSAYDRPRYTTAEIIRRDKEDFQNDWYRACDRERN